MQFVINHFLFVINVIMYVKSMQKKTTKKTFADVNFYEMSRKHTSAVPNHVLLVE